MRICVITDMDSTNSGYRTIAVPLLTGLVELGHEVKICGIGYRGEEHNFPFSIIPAGNINDALAIATNINMLWNPDVFLVAMDIPLQQFYFENLRKFNRKYIAITPLENGPLTPSWANILIGTDAVFFISELGKQEAIKAGLIKAEHLEVGIDLSAWRPATKEERETLRSGLGIAEDEFVVLTVADNQERKNLWGGMAAVSLLKKDGVKLKYLLVTRKDSPFGWKFPDLPLSLDLVKEVQLFDRGMPQKDLWGLYAASDAYLQPSKAEGLGLPVMEAMATGIPCVATDTGALHELLDDGRGFLVESAMDIIDVWGNEKRSFLNIEKARDILMRIAKTEIPFTAPNKATTFIQSRTWDKPIKQMNEKISEICDVSQQTKK